MSIDDAIYCLKARSDSFPQTCEDCQYYSSDSSCENEVCDMAIRSLEMQKKLAEFRGMDICKWVEDYDYDEDNTSEYEFEASVDDFLIDEVKEGKEEKQKIPEPYKAEMESGVCKGCHYNDGEVHAECVVCDKAEMEGEE